MQKLIITLNYWEKECIDDALSLTIYSPYV